MGSLVTIAFYSEDSKISKLDYAQAPDPKQIRPPAVLKKSLTSVQQKWQANQDYRYTCEQLKSIRQDLTVSVSFVCCLFQSSVERDIVGT